LLVSQTDTVLSIPADVTETTTGPENLMNILLKISSREIYFVGLQWVYAINYIQLNTAVSYRTYTCASFITGHFRNGFLPHIDTAVSCKWKQL